MKFNKILITISAIFTSLVLVGCSSSVLPPPPEAFKFSNNILTANYSHRVTDFATNVLAKISKTGPSFTIVALPEDRNLTLLTVLSDADLKQYTDPQVKAAYLDDIKKLDGNIEFSIIIQHLGSYNDDAKIQLDDKSYEYFRLENDKGDSVKAVKQDQLNPNDYQVYMGDESVALNIYFPEKDVENLMATSNSLTLVFPGVPALPDGQRFIQLQSPFSKYYEKDFPELAGMLQQLNQ